MKILALDVGGTSIKSALFVDDAMIISTEMPSDGIQGRESILQSIHKCISEYKEFDCIGISTTGQVDSTKGIVIGSCENVPGYNDTNLKELFETAYQVPVYVENDVNAAALGEAYFGCCTDQPDFLCLTYGTGIGGAIITNRKLYTGSLGIAGEFGHLLTHPGGLLCNCRNRGCYEKYASATALIEKVTEVYPELTNGRLIFQRAQENDARLKGLINEWITEITYGLVTITHIFNPSVIVLGGGVMAQAELLPQIQDRLRSQVMDQFSRVSLKTASLGNHAGIYGMVAAITKVKTN